MNVRALLASTLLAASAANANTPADYAYTFPIETAASPQDGNSAWRIELTPEVYAWVQDAALRDVEVFNAARLPVPFARIATEPAATSREQNVPLPVLALPAAASGAAASDLRLVIDRDADGRLRRIDAGEQTPATTKSTVRDWLLDASAVDRAIDSVVLAWTAPTSGVVARFSIEAGDDLQTWRNAGSGTVLALEQAGARLERHDIVLGGVRAKYLRLHRLDDGADLSGLGAQAHSVERGHAAPARGWLDAALVATPADVELPAGVARFDYALASALPIHAARIELANDNALAPLTLSARMPGSPGREWSDLARVTAFRLRSGDETIRNSDIDLTSTPRLREFRIESRVPLAAAPRLALGYRPDSFVFLAEGDGPWTLAVGSARVRRADYPVDAALAGLRAKSGKDWQPPLAKLGAARESAGAIALKPPPAPTPWRRWLLWSVLVAGAAVVGGFAISLLRGTRDNKP
ncbi:DUF3999 domain-containing protein [Dokdonella soli]|uniref:DUF3999 domain-containing protein n=1 Tax=Dokdonella soli TaxID=529810 RepID=A0ABN1IPV3_9GAMM